MSKKKILFPLAAILVVVVGVAGLSAYEAHVINVKAHIENALSVTPEEIDFGTVFPQEYLTKPLTITMSSSFLEEERVDDINYVIAQKPKPRNPEDWEYCLEEWESALDDFMCCFFDCYGEGGNDEYCWHECKDIFFNYADPQRCYPPLCPWLSETPDGTPPNDTGIMPFQGLFDVAEGRLAKSEGDTGDNWIIDLIVSCFQGMCAQDYSWEEFGPPMPPEFEGETFGCDLWVEVTGISEDGHCVPTQEVCDDQLDNDCDGFVDCNDEDCAQAQNCQPQTECEPQSQRVCDTGQLGICAAGTQTCSLEGTWGSCIPDNSQTTEVCNNDLDDDCDGSVDCYDEDCAQAPNCSQTNGLSGWDYRREVTLGFANIDSNLTDFPVLVKLTDSNFNFTKAQNDGEDIRFTLADGTTLLSYERERHDSVGELAEYWVKIPSVSSITNTVFYMYYGNSGAADGADPTNVWDSNFKSVWHLTETSGDYQDSTVNNHDIDIISEVSRNQNGQIYRGLLSDNTDYMTTPNSADFSPEGGTFAVELWLRSTITNQDGWSAIWRDYGGDSDNFVFVNLAENDDKVRTIFRDGYGNSIDITGTTDLGTTDWYHIVAVRDSQTTAKIYLNGSQDASDSNGSLGIIGTSNGTLPYFLNQSAESHSALDAYVDEVRITKGNARSQAWWKASYYSGIDGLLAFGVEVAL